MVSRTDVIEISKSTDRPKLQLVLVTIFLFLLFLAYLQIGLGFDLLRSDVLSYWNESFNWKTPFGNWWVPGYSLTIALVGAVTLDLLSPVAVMVLISGAFYVIGVRTAYSLAKELKIGSAFETALLFAAYPFVGLTYSVYPIADSMATALLLLSALCFQRQRWTSFAIYAGLAMLTHKATWFFIPPLLAVAFIRHKESRLPVLLSQIPLLAWIIAGAFYHGDALWFARWSVTNLVVSKRMLPVFDGLVGPLLSRNAAKIIKGLVVLATFLSAVAVFIYSLRFRFWFGICIAFSIISMIAFINQYEIWAAVRWSKILLIPLTYILLCRASVFRSSRISSPVFLLLFLIGVTSNVLFGYYLTRLLSP